MPALFNYSILFLYRDLLASYCLCSCLHILTLQRSQFSVLILCIVDQYLHGFAYLLREEPSQQFLILSLLRLRDEFLLLAAIFSLCYESILFVVDLLRLEKLSTGNVNNLCSSCSLKLVVTLQISEKNYSFVKLLFSLMILFTIDSINVFILSFRLSLLQLFLLICPICFVSSQLKIYDSLVQMALEVDREWSQSSYTIADRYYFRYFETPFSSSGRLRGSQGRQYYLTGLLHLSTSIVWRRRLFFFMRPIERESDTGGGYLAPQTYMFDSVVALCSTSISQVSVIFNTVICKESETLSLE